MREDHGLESLQARLARRRIRLLVGLAWTDGLEETELPYRVPSTNNVTERVMARAGRIRYKTMRGLKAKDNRLAPPGSPAQSGTSPRKPLFPPSEPAGAGFV